MIVAKKVAKKLLDENKGRGRILFSIRETTKDSKKKTYCYVAMRDGDKVKVSVDKKNVKRGGALSKSFYLKRSDGSYFKPKDYKLHPEFEIKEDDLNSVNFALYIDKGILKHPYLVYENGEYIQKNDGTAINQFRILYKEDKYYLQNIVSNEEFIIENTHKPPRVSVDRSSTIDSTKVWRTAESFMNDR